MNLVVFKEYLVVIISLIVVIHKHVQMVLLIKLQQYREEL